MAAVAVAVVVVLVVASVRSGAAERDDAARAAAVALAQGLSSGELGSTPLLDVDGAPSQEQAQEQHAAVIAGMAPLRPSVEVADVERDDDSASATLDVSWPLEPAWTYSVEADLAPASADDPTGRWAARWDPALVEPSLGDGDVLADERVPAPRGDITGRGGVDVVTQTPVVDVGVQPSRTQDPAALSSELARVLDVDAAALAERISAADPSAFVPVITLRRADYAAVAAELEPLAGTVLRESTLALAPSRTFAQATLGAVGPATAEDVEASDGRVTGEDVVGRSGLQRAYDERLGGVPGLVVSRVPAGGDTVTLLERAPVPGQPIATTLDPRVQDAAQGALDTAVAAGAGNGNSSLVAVDVPTGGVLAVANTPAAGGNLALTGRYPPGSTFKPVSTLALLGSGLTPQQQVGCPPTISVNGRSFRNFEGESFGTVPFARAFAVSCNTAFVGLSREITMDDLADAGASVGLGGDWSLGLDAFTGDVPRAGAPDEVAASTLGQGRVVASPAAMAAAVSTIARGSWTPPTLVTDPAPPAPADAPSPDPARLATVAQLMRGVATGGTAAALSDVPGAPVHAKTGTAEHGSVEPLRTHAWTVGFQGDVAFAVIVEDGSSGGEVAVPVAEDFLRRLAG